MRTLRTHLAVLAGVLVANSSISMSQTVAPRDYTSDARLLKINQFFRALNSPAYSLAEDFLVAADRNGLDWRLLPSLSVLESGGGKSYRNNNILGWASCERSFPTVSAGIHHVAFRLAESRLYRGKTLDDLLRLYNPDDEYTERVRELMNQLAPGRDGPGEAR